MKLSNILKVTVQFVSDHSNAILSGISIAGTIAAVIFAAKDTPKCMEILEELEAEGASNREKAGAVVKTMGRTGVAAGVSIAATIANGSLNGKKIDSLLMKYQLASSGKDLYKTITREVVGDELADKIDEKVALSYKPKYDDDGNYVQKVYNTGKGEDLFYLKLGDWAPGVLFRSNIDYIKNLGVDFRDRIINGDETLLLNEVLLELKLPKSQISSESRLGWHPDRFSQYRRGPFFKFHAAMDDNDKPYTVVEFECEPMSISKPNSVRYHS